MNRKTHALTLSAMFTAFCSAVLYLSSLSPTGQLGIVAFASVFIAAAIIECGLLHGVCVYAASSLIGAILLPVRGAFLLYLLFFGYYPVVKHLIEKIDGFLTQWILKLALFNIVLTMIWFLLKELIFAFAGKQIGYIIVYAAANVIYVLYDYGYTKLIRLYIYRISDRIKRK